MKTRVYLGVIALLVCQAMAAQYKVVERSSKQRPTWIAETLPGYITFSAEGSTLQLAQQKCMDEIRNEIILSIAVNITSESSTAMGQKRVNDKFYTSEEFKSQFTAKAANLPFVTGISIANAEATYWEKVYNRDTKESHWVYYIRYPFSRMERDRLISEFLAYDGEKYGQLTDIRRQADSIVCVDDIRTMITRLEPLKEYFFDATRQEEVSAMQEELRQLYKSIQVSPISNVPGRYVYALMLKGRRVTMGRTPTSKSQFAHNISIAPNRGDTTYVVSYSYDGCLPEEENQVELLFNFYGSSQRHRFFFNLTESTLDVVPYGVVDISGRVSDDGRSMRDVSVRLNLRARYDVGFGIERVQLSTPEFPAVSISPATAEVYGRGMNQIVLRTDSTDYRPGKSGSLTDGVVVVKNAATGERKTILLRLPYYVGERR